MRENLKKELGQDIEEDTKGVIEEKTEEKNEEKTEENINEKTVEHMNRSMDQLREIWDYMERQTESAYQICTDQNGEKICIHADAYHRQERLIRKK